MGVSLSGLSVRDARRAVAAHLRKAGVEDGLGDARLLLEEATGLSRSNIIAEPDRLLTDEQAHKLEALADRRAAREPVSHILGRKGFWTLELETSADTLTPRPETEHVVEAALSLLAPDASARILDLGAGTGAILLSVLSERANAWGVGVDRSPAAALTAQRNAARLGLSARAFMMVGDWEAALTGPFDLIVSNPPYIRSSLIDHLEPEVRAEPRLALDGGADGLCAYRRIIAGCARVLAPGGGLALEAGFDQASEVLTLLSETGLYSDIETVFDLAGHGRVVRARRV